MSDPTHPRLRLRIVLAPGVMLGPGKADLLAGIAATGSIAAAGRHMKMSYKRAWSLVEAMNTMFDAPLVTSARGGQQGGGAHLTETGQKVLSAYRALEIKAASAGRDEMATLASLLGDISDGK